MAKIILRPEARIQTLKYLTERKEAVLNGLIAAYKGRILDSNSAFGYIGELSSLTATISDLNDQTKAESRETQKMLKGE